MTTDDEENDGDVLNHKVKDCLDLYGLLWKILTGQAGDRRPWVILDAGSKLVAPRFR